jgi:hypothetical protein
MGYRLSDPDNGLGVDIEITTRGNIYRFNIPPEGNLSDLIAFSESLIALGASSTFCYKDKH